jgi:hypothetical protein
LQRYSAPVVVARSLLTNLTSRLGALGHEIADVRSGVQSLEGRVDARCDVLQKQLHSLTGDFREFVQQDKAHKDIALSETRLVRVRQELETNFGFYAEIRRRATGILQASDLAIVREETIRNSTEEAMIGAPGYWLAPALVAIASWIADKQDLAGKALAEAMRRDDAKTSLLLCLVSRRLGRHDTAQRWLVRYLGLQDPFALDREAVVLVDALASGVFGGANATQTLASIDAWTDEIKNRVGVVERERARWKQAILDMRSAPAANEYPNLTKYSSTWPQLAAALAGVRLNEQLEKRVATMYDGDLALSPKLVNRVDELVDDLVRRFDDDELPLRREERKLELIITGSGDRATAEANLALESPAFAERTSFVALLTNAALGMGVGRVSRATQRLAFALSTPWIVEAHDDVVTGVRAAQPATIDLAIDGWTGASADGRDEAELFASLRCALATEESAATAAAYGLTFWWPALVAAAFLALAFFSKYLLVGALIFAIVQLAFYLLSLPPARVRKAHFAARRDAGVTAVEASCAEIVDLRAEIAREDARAPGVRAQLSAISASEHMGASLDGRRKIVA